MIHKTINKSIIVFVLCLTVSFLLAQDIPNTPYVITNRWTKDKLCTITGWPTMSIVDEAGWMVEKDNTQPDQIRLKHAVSGQYLGSFYDSLYSSAVITDKSHALWKLEKINTTFYRIIHVATGSALNTELGHLACNKTLRGWFSGHWRFDKEILPHKVVGASFKNRWTNKFLVDSNANVVVSKIDSGSWVIEPMPGVTNSIRIRSLGVGKYLFEENGMLKIGTIDPSLPAAQWQIEKVLNRDYYRIISKSYLYLNNEPNKLNLIATQPGWWQTQWQVTFWKF